MSENIYKINLKGAAFTEQAILPLFTDPKERMREYQF